jgi:hypothetical protein
MAAGIERAISIRQPYAELILRGQKRWEFRSVNTTLIGERVWIYASSRPVRDLTAWRSIELGSELPLGVIVGSVVIVGVEKRGERDFAYKLTDPKRCRPKWPTNQPQPLFWRPEF